MTSTDLGATPAQDAPGALPAHPEDWHAPPPRAVRLHAGFMAAMFALCAIGSLAGPMLAMDELGVARIGGTLLAFALATAFGAWIGARLRHQRWKLDAEGLWLRNGRLWLATPAAVLNGGMRPVLGAAYFVLRPEVGAGGSLEVVVDDSGLVSVDGASLAAPSAAGSPMSQTGLLTFVVVGPKRDPTLAYATFAPTTGPSDVRPLGAAGAPPGRGPGRGSDALRAGVPRWTTAGWTASR